MQLKSKHLLEARILVDEHVIQSLSGLLSITLLVYVVLDICLVGFSLEGVSSNRLIIAIEDDAFVDGLAGHSVLHASDNLEGVVVELLRGGDGGVAEAVLEVVLEQESICHFVEVKCVLVVQVKLHGLLDRREGGLVMLHCVSCC